MLRFQQTTPPVHAKGVEDTAFYRYFGSSALNEVGGDPGRFSLSVEEFHAANLERARAPRSCSRRRRTTPSAAATSARGSVVLDGMPDEWAARSGAGGDLGGRWPDPNEAYLVLADARRRLAADARSGSTVYLEKALREGKLNSNWARPDEADWSGG